MLRIKTSLRNCGLSFTITTNNNTNSSNALGANNNDSVILLTSVVRKFLLQRCYDQANVRYILSDNLIDKILYGKLDYKNDRPLVVTMCSWFERTTENITLQTLARPGLVSSVFK